jgi:hypothetical protein
MDKKVVGAVLFVIVFALALFFLGVLPSENGTNALLAPQRVAQSSPLLSFMPQTSLNSKWYADLVRNPPEGTKIVRYGNIGNELKGFYSEQSNLAALSNIKEREVSGKVFDGVILQDLSTGQLSFALPEGCHHGPLFSCHDGGLCASLFFGHCDHSGILCWCHIWGGSGVVAIDSETTSEVSSGNDLTKP